MHALFFCAYGKCNLMQFSDCKLIGLIMFPPRILDHSLTSVDTEPNDPGTTSFDGSISTQTTATRHQL